MDNGMVELEKILDFFQNISAKEYRELYQKASDYEPSYRHISCYKNILELFSTDNFEEVIALAQITLSQFTTSVSLPTILELPSTDNFEEVIASEQIILSESATSVSLPTILELPSTDNFEEVIASEQIILSESATSASLPVTESSITGSFEERIAIEYQLQSSNTHISFDITDDIFRECA